MTKNKFRQECFRYGCTAHYSGNTQTMYVFGGWEGLSNLVGGGFRNGHRYTPSWLSFGVVVQRTN